MWTSVRSRLIDPIRTLLTQGVTPDTLALSLAVGLIVGIFPVMGTTTLLCTAAALALRLNLLAVHTVHYAMTPVQILLIIPFVRVGEHVTNAAPQPLSISSGMALIAEGAGHAVVVLWSAIVHAVIGWVAIGPIAIVLCWFGLRTLLIAARRHQAH
jgi:hypothetical protein